jgi:hypothetical protein
MGRPVTKIRVLVVFALVLSLSACSDSHPRSPVALVTDSGHRSPTNRPSPTHRKAHRSSRTVAFETLVAAPWPAGSLEWGCSNSGHSIIMLQLPKMGATESVRVYDGQRLVVIRINVNPGDRIRLSLPNDSYQRWLIRQATEPLTLAVTIRIDPNPVNGCRTYLPPTVHLKSLSHSH